MLEVWIIIHEGISQHMHFAAWLLDLEVLLHIWSFLQRFKSCVHYSIIANESEIYLQMFHSLSLTRLNQRFDIWVLFKEISGGLYRNLQLILILSWKRIYFVKFAYAIYIFHVLRPT